MIRLGEKKKMEFALLVYGLLLIGIVSDVQASENEKNLIQSLLANYSVNSRPVKSGIYYRDENTHLNQNVTIHINIALRQILLLDERNEVLKAVYWISRKWHDIELTWNPKDYDGIEEIHLSVKRIWKPDITLYNDVSDMRRDVEKLYPAIIHYSGEVEWNTLEIITSTCPMNVKYFPWDHQNCTLRLGSWVLDGYELDVVLQNKTHEENGHQRGHGDMSKFIQHSQWKFVDFPGERIVSYYPVPYPTTDFFLVLQRKPLYYLFNMVLPCLFISFCGMLGVFVLPAAAGEKVSLAVTMLLASTFFLLIIAEVMPTQSDVIPLIAQYFQISIFLLVCSTTLTVFVLQCHHKGTLLYHVPWLIKTLALKKLARYVFLSYLVTHLLGEDWDAAHHKPNKVGDVQQANATRGSVTQDRLHSLTEGKEAEVISEAERCRREWMLVGMVMDRVFFVFFAIVNTVATMAVLLNH